jgi:thiamine thiazole synthase
MDHFEELEVSRAILDAYHAKFAKALESDAIIVGGGPFGHGGCLAAGAGGSWVVLLEKRLSPGGGIWGGSMGMYEVPFNARPWTF